MIGVIGIGQMGKPIAKNISRCGYEITIWNRTPERAESISGNGIYIAKSPKELAGISDTIIMILSNNEAVSDVVFGENGIYGADIENKVIIDMSTISPAFSREVAEKIRERKASFLDAPLIGSVPQAERAELTVLVGGELEKFNSVLYIFKCIGKNIFYIGPNGSGLAMKMINNIVLGGNIEILSEALNLGESLGLSKRLMLDILSLGSAGSRILEMKRDNLVNNEFQPMFKLEHEEKDLNYALELSRKLNVPMPATSVIHEVYKSSLARKRGSLDISSIYIVLRELSGKQ